MGQSHRVNQQECLNAAEIIPKEFAQFIGKGMRLSKIEFAPRAESGPIFDFYMGKNTPERKDYIMDSLVVPVEE
jgi:topoisomerase IV subunit B